MPGEQWPHLAAIFTEHRYAAREHVVLPGATTHYIYFVCHGLLRFYYGGAYGAEWNKALVAEHTFAGSLAAYRLNRPLMYGVQALEPTLILKAPYGEFVALFDRHPAFDRLGRLLAEWLLLGKELRTRSLLHQDATERYNDFVANFPDLHARIPLYHIASYLGITDVSLSRVRRGIATAATPINPPDAA